MYNLFYVSLFENLISEKMQIVHENDFILKLFQNGFIQNAHATENVYSLEIMQIISQTEPDRLAVSSLNSNRNLASLCAARPNSDIQF